MKNSFLEPMLFFLLFSLVRSNFFHCYTTNFFSSPKLPNETKQKLSTSCVHFQLTNDNLPFAFIYSFTQLITVVHSLHVRTILDYFSGLVEYLLNLPMRGWALQRQMLCTVAPDPDGMLQGPYVLLVILVIVFSDIWKLSEWKVTFHENFLTAYCCPWAWQILPLDLYKRKTRFSRRAGWQRGTSSLRPEPPIRALQKELERHNLKRE